MSLEVCYAFMDGDLKGVRSRLLSDERIEKFVPMFLKDRSMETLRASLSSGALDDAYRAAHTIKGTSRDLGFTHLFEVSERMQEALRPPADGSPVDLAAAEALMAELEAEYARTVQAIDLL